MSEVFFISDTHFGHEATCTKFTKPDGVTPLRPFANAEEMNEAMVDRWNAVVRPQDLVIHLGDVVMSHRHLPTVGRLNGTKHLVVGNHDPINGKKAKKFNFSDYFERIDALREYHGYILTHFPVHTCSVGRWGVNIHGHLHAEEVRVQCGYPELRHTMVPDSRYLNVGVEHTDFQPITFDEVQRRIKERQEMYPPVNQRDHSGAS